MSGSQSPLSGGRLGRRASKRRCTPMLPPLSASVEASLCQIAMARRACNSIVRTSVLCLTFRLLAPPLAVHLPELATIDDLIARATFGWLKTKIGSNLMVNWLRTPGCSRQRLFSHSMSPPWETTSSQRSNSAVLGDSCRSTNVSRLASKHSFL